SACFFSAIRPRPRATRFPYTTLFRSGGELKLGGGGSLGVAYKHPSGNPGCLHTFRPAAPAVRRGEPVEVGAFLHQVSLQSRSMSSVEDSKSSAWALRYSNANL